MNLHKFQSFIETFIIYLILKESLSKRKTLLIQN